MKERALRHLLLASARSARLLVDEGTRRRIDEISATLSVSRSRGHGYVIEWIDPAGSGRHCVPSGQFAFYTRGDIDALVERRASGLDERSSNWLAAHRVWGEMVDAALLRSMVATPDLAIPVEGRPSPPGLGWAVWLSAGLALAAQAGSARGWAAPIAVVLAAAVMGGWRSAGDRRPVVFGTVVSATAASLSAVLVWLEPSPAVLPAAAAGLGAVLLSVGVVPGSTCSRLWADPSAYGAALATGLLTTWAPKGFSVVAVVLVVVDLGAAALRGESMRLRFGLVAAFLALLAASLGAVLIDGRRPLAAADRSMLVLVGLAALVAVSVAVVSATHGVSDRLADAAAPTVLAITTLAGGAGRADGGAPMIAIVACATALASSRLASDAFLRWRRPSATSPSGPTVHVMTSGTTCGIGSAPEARQAQSAPVPVRIGIRREA